MLTFTAEIVTTLPRRLLIISSVKSVLFDSVMTTFTRCLFLNSGSDVNPPLILPPYLSSRLCGITCIITHIPQKKKLNMKHNQNNVFGVATVNPNTIRQNIVTTLRLNCSTSTLSLWISSALVSAIIFFIICMTSCRSQLNTS